MTKKAAPQQEKFCLQDIQKCSGKKIYGSKNEARDFAKARRWAQMPYKCPICRNWHLTHHTSDDKAVVREKVNARMVQPKQIKAKMRSPETFPEGTIVLTPLGRRAKVVKHTRYDRSTPGRRLGVERLVCEYLDEPRKQFAIVWLKPEDVRAV